MSRFRKVDPRIWNDEKFRSLSKDGKLVFFMLLTHPNMTALGAMRATISGLAEEVAWPIEDFRKAFADVLSKGMAEHDQAACLIALPKFIKYNQPESPNVVKAWVHSVDMLPECSLKKATIQRAKAFADALPEAFAKAFREAFAKSMANQEHKQKPKKTPPIPPKGGKPLVGLKDWIEAVRASGEKPIADDDPVIEYAEAVQLPSDFLRLAWLEFRHHYSQPEAKKYRDWRAVFRKAVRGNWLKLWWLDGEQYRLTTRGEQAKRAHEDRAA